jgi:hypothetical protein
MMDLRQAMQLSAKYFWPSLVKWTPYLLVTSGRLVSLVAVLSVLLNFVTGATVDYSDIFTTRIINNPSQVIMQDDKFRQGFPWAVRIGQAGAAALGGTTRCEKIPR